jgi:hypothetical protein
MACKGLVVSSPKIVNPGETCDVWPLRTMRWMSCGDRQEVGHFAKHIVKCCHNRACPLRDPSYSRLEYLSRRSMSTSWQPKIPPYSLNLCLCDTDDLEIGAKTKETVAYPRPTPNSLELHSMRALCRHITFFRPFVGRVFAKELHILQHQQGQPRIPRQVGDRTK